MSLRKFISGVSAFAAMAVTASIIMTSVAMLAMPSALAEEYTFTEDFSNYEANTSDADLMTSLIRNGWHLVNNNSVIENPDNSLYSNFVKIVNSSGNNVLQIDTPAHNKDNNVYGLGRFFPGFEDKNATGTWEIKFRFAPYYTTNYNIQFNFSLNSNNTSISDTIAQHNIVSAYNNVYYVGHRNYLTLYNGGNNPIPQGSISVTPSNAANKFVDVKAIVNCDSRYYSVELSQNDKLLARRSPISFDASEPISFLKLSALGMGKFHRVYVDDISIKQTEADPIIYEDNFDSYTDDSYRASSGVTIGGTTENVGGNSYFEGYTPWRALSSSGNYYKFETGPDNTKAVRLGSETESSGLVYMPVKDKLVTQATQAARGYLRVSFSVMPDTIAAEKGYQVYFTPEYNGTSAKAFEIVKNSETNKVYIVRPSGSKEIDGSKWYDVELTFDVVNHTVKTKAREHGTTEVLSFSTTIPSLEAVKGLLFNATDKTSVVLDDVSIRYIVPTVETTEEDLRDPETSEDVFTADNKVYARAFTSYITSNGITINKVNITVPNAKPETQTIDMPVTSGTGDVFIGIILASKDSTTIETFDKDTIKVTVE